MGDKPPEFNGRALIAWLAAKQGMPLGFIAHALGFEPGEILPIIDDCDARVAYMDEEWELPSSLDEELQEPPERKPKRKA